MREWSGNRGVRRQWVGDTGVRGHRDQGTGVRNRGVMGHRGLGIEGTLTDRLGTEGSGTGGQIQWGKEQTY